MLVYDSALFDANVLHPYASCDLIIRLHRKRMFRARWTAKILDEVVRSVHRAQDIPIDRLQKRVNAMNRAVADALVEDSVELERRHADCGTDAHVVAAAIIGRVDVLVTDNLKDFTTPALRASGIEVLSLDAFLMQLWNTDPEQVEHALREQTAALKDPPFRLSDTLSALSKNAPLFAAAAADVLVEP